MLRMNQMHSEREYIAVPPHVPEALWPNRLDHPTLLCDLDFDFDFDFDFEYMQPQ